jgi:hypothetical protein
MEYNLSGGALTDALAFTPKQPGASSRSYRTIVLPINSGALNPGDVVKMDIPVGRQNAYIDTSETYLTFQVNNTGTQPFNLDGSAYCFFNRLDVLSQGQVLESIQAYNVLVNTLTDLQQDAIVSTTSGTIHMGTGFDTVESINIAKKGQAITNGGVQDFSIPLALSGVLGPGCSKYLPISKITDLRLELTIENAIQAVVQATGTTAFTLNNIQLILTYVDIDPMVASQLEQAVGGRYIISSESWRNYTSILPANRSGDSVLIPARYSSMRTLLHVWRDYANNSDQTKYWLSARSNPFYSSTGVQSQIQYAIGLVLVPQTPVKFVSEMWMNGQQAFHQLGSISNGSRCYYTNWNQSAYNDSSTYSMGTFAFAQNFDSFLNKSDSLTVGFNTINSPTFLNITYPASVATQHRLDSFVHFDVVLDISDAGLVARY